jgi:hypothetical protein
MYLPIRMCGSGLTQLRRVLLVTQLRVTWSIWASCSGVMMSLGCSKEFSQARICLGEAWKPGGEAVKTANSHY